MICMRRKRYKIKKLNVIIFIIGVICFIFLIISLINIIHWKLNSNEIKEETNNINEIVEITEVEETEEQEIEIIEQEVEPEPFNPYWDYIKMNLIDVEFNKLKTINNDTKGWIQVNGTNINYPFVQATDNKYYLTHTFNKNYNSAGWVFLDYRNNINELNKNTIIYAHGRDDKTMFGSLKNILKSGWLNNTDNYIIKLSTETHNTLWQVFSVYRIPTTSDYLKIDFYSNEDFIDFTNKLINRSKHNFNTTINGNDKILTLSTCYNDDDKVVLHSKLIKIETKNS